MEDFMNKKGGSEAGQMPRYTVYGDHPSQGAQSTSGGILPHNSINTAAVPEHIEDRALEATYLAEDKKSKYPVPDRTHWTMTEKSLMIVRLRNKPMQQGRKSSPYDRTTNMSDLQVSDNYNGLTKEDAHMNTRFAGWLLSRYDGTTDRSYNKEMDMGIGQHGVFTCFNCSRLSIPPGAYVGIRPQDSTVVVTGKDGGTPVHTLMPQTRNVSQPVGKFFPQLYEIKDAIVSQAFVGVYSSAHLTKWEDEVEGKQAPLRGEIRAAASRDAAIKVLETHTQTMMHQAEKTGFTNKEIEDDGAKYFAELTPMLCMRKVINLLLSSPVFHDSLNRDDPCFALIVRLAMFFRNEGHMASLQATDLTLSVPEQAFADRYGDAICIRYGICGAMRFAMDQTRSLCTVLRNNTVGMATQTIKPMSDGDVLLSVV